MPANPTRIAALVLELGASCGRLAGFVEWLGRDFPTTLATRTSALAALPPNEIDAKAFAAVAPTVEARLREMIDLVGQASDGCSSLVDAAREILGELPRSS
ncbi:MAG: hypothetical protein ACKV2T_17150 [Kofleriaceae bacterium]